MTPDDRLLPDGTMLSRPSSLAVSIALVAALASGAAWAQRRPDALVQGTQVGKAVFPPGDTARGGNGRAVDGIEALDREMLKTHFHAHLALFYRGGQIAVPYGIGIVQPFQAERGFIGRGSAIYWVRTHDATGIIHVESPDERTYTLGLQDHTQVTLVVGKPLITPPRYEFPAGL
jgi:hypothetical protein